MSPVTSFGQLRPISASERPTVATSRASSYRQKSPTPARHRREIAAGAIDTSEGSDARPDDSGGHDMFGDDKPQTPKETPAPAAKGTDQKSGSRVKTRDNAENDYVFSDWASI